MTRHLGVRDAHAGEPCEVSYWCANGHRTPRSWSATATAPDQWVCRHCGLPAGRDNAHPPAPVAHRPFKTPLTHLLERRSEAECEALLDEALQRLRAHRRSRGRPPARPRRARVRVARVYDERTAQDGARVLVDGLWPRGLSKDRADLDEWCREIAPSATLRRWYGHDPDRFAEFGRRYRLELDDPGRAEPLQRLRGLARRQPLTLLTATRTTEISQAAVLADLIAVENGTE